MLANLKPAQLRGIESAGMILATDRKDGKVVPVDPGSASPGDLATVDGVPSAPKSKISKGDFDKAPLEIRGGKVTYAGKPLKTAAGDVTCDGRTGEGSLSRRWPHAVTGPRSRRGAASSAPHRAARRANSPGRSRP